MIKFKNEDKSSLNSHSSGFGCGFYEHEYENEIIVKNNTVYKKQLEKSGITLAENSYVFG